jgi:nitrogen fixation/metabolism regulation signal transduction histidine kinase
MGFQKDFILRYCSVVLIAVLVLSLFVYSFCGTTVTTIFKDSRLKILSTNDFILPYLFWSSVIAVLCAVAVCWRMTMAISNRLAGPLYKFEQDIAQVAQGDLTLTVRVRQKDEFKSLARLFNTLTGDWRRDMIHLKNQIDKLDKSRDLSSKDRAIIDNLKEALAKYKV